MEEHGRRVIRDHMPDQHREFFAQLPFMIVSTMDDAGQPWAGILAGEPGFVATPDEQHLRMDALPEASDPIQAGLRLGEPIGMIGIDLATRRRNRMNGIVRSLDGRGLTVSVSQSFGNCPKYIQKRAVSFVRDPRTPHEIAVDRSAMLDAEAMAQIHTADTAFVASGLPGALDISHRGGRPGFIRVDGNQLTIPEFAGNGFFNTLGNLLLQPKAGLLFIDFETGNLLHLAGRAAVDFDGPEIAQFEGAQRLWRFEVTEMVRRRDALPLRWNFEEFSPFALATGHWDSVNQAETASQ
jgi:predicted pyridoxine 5'-phosphate oxidase superfamily flavin-nucleotide-binding protein